VAARDRRQPDPRQQLHLHDLGAPTTATHNGVPDLGFRFTYVGQYDVQWDNVFSLGLAYMHARHYSPVLGRFLQPDPDGSEINLYAYAADNPVTQIDPDGTCFIICAIVSAVVSVAIYAVTTDSSKWNLGDAAREGAVGFAAGFIGVGLLSKIGTLGRLASAVGRGSQALSRVGSAIGRGFSAAGRGVGRVATHVAETAKYVAQNGLGARANWIRFGRTAIPKPGGGYTLYNNAVRLGTSQAYKGNYRLPFGAHIHSDNLFKPWTWFHSNL
jgi:RHS repeat-associated protein